MSFLAILVVVAALAFMLFVVGPLLVWLVTAFDRPRLHWWEQDSNTERQPE